MLGQERFTNASMVKIMRKISDMILMVFAAIILRTMGLFGISADMIDDIDA